MARACKRLDAPITSMCGSLTDSERGHNRDSGLIGRLLTQVYTMLGGMAGRSAQHRDMLCRMAALSLAALASGSLQSDTNQQLAARCMSKGSLDTRSDCCNLHGIVLRPSQPNFTPVSCPCC